ARTDAGDVEFDSWDLCDQVCGNLFDRTPHAFRKAKGWSAGSSEFERRAGFATMACAAVHRKDVGDEPFEAFLPVIVGASTDERNYVKKAVSCALLQIGKRDTAMNRKAIASAKEISGLDSGAARWIVADALREVTSPAVQNRLRRNSGEGRRGRGRPLRPSAGRPASVSRRPEPCPPRDRSQARERARASARGPPPGSAAATGATTVGTRSRLPAGAWLTERGGSGRSWRPRTRPPPGRIPFAGVDRGAPPRTLRRPPP